MYFQTLTNCASVKTVPFELEITYSDSDFSLASLRQALSLIHIWLPHRRQHLHAGRRRNGNFRGEGCACQEGRHLSELSLIHIY